jgi:hypothetical protein
MRSDQKDRPCLLLAHAVPKLVSLGVVQALVLREAVDSLTLDAGKPGGEKRNHLPVDYLNKRPFGLHFGNLVLADSHENSLFFVAHIFHGIEFTHYDERHLDDPARQVFAVGEITSVKDSVASQRENVVRDF